MQLAIWQINACVIDGNFAGALYYLSIRRTLLLDKLLLDKFDCVILCRSGRCILQFLSLELIFHLSYSPEWYLYACYN